MRLLMTVFHIHDKNPCIAYILK
uniref:Uncharacterized protein n=1 Tax=Anguilla anguilla TaxID=7936 RepID=A0A0E9URC9_ANGAN